MKTFDCQKSKCNSSYSVTFMGHELTDQGVKADSDKVDAVRGMPRPLDKAGVQRFWVCANICQNLPKFSETVLPSKFNKTKRLIASSKNLR